MLMCFARVKSQETRDFDNVGGDAFFLLLFFFFSGYVVSRLS